MKERIAFDWKLFWESLEWDNERQATPTVETYTEFKGFKGVCRVMDITILESDKRIVFYLLDIETNEKYTSLFNIVFRDSINTPKSLANGNRIMNIYAGYYHLIEQHN